MLAQNPTPFFFRKGAAALEAVRLASAFFGKRPFAGDPPSASAQAVAGSSRSSKA